MRACSHRSATKKNNRSRPLIPPATQGTISILSYRQPIFTWNIFSFLAGLRLKSGIPRRIFHNHLALAKFGKCLPISMKVTHFYGKRDCRRRYAKFKGIAELPPKTCQDSLLLGSYVFRMVSERGEWLATTRKGPWKGKEGRFTPVFSFPPSFARQFSLRERRLGTRQDVAKYHPTGDKCYLKNIR